MSDSPSYQLAHINDSRITMLITSGAICLPAAYMAVALRFISRKLVRARVEADDLLILLALVSRLCPCGIEIMN